MSDFDYHREMTAALSNAPSSESRDLVWIMTEEHRERFRVFQQDIMGAEPDNEEAFGIAIWTGEPANGQPVELVVKPAH